jgi:hypothetical protein
VEARSGDRLIANGDHQPKVVVERG